MKMLGEDLFVSSRYAPETDLLAADEVFAVRMIVVLERIYIEISCNKAEVSLQ